MNYDDLEYARLVTAQKEGVDRKADRAMPFRFEFGRRILLVTLFPEAETDVQGKRRLVYPTSFLDKIVKVLYDFDKSKMGGGELHPKFYDWEKDKWISLRRWKGMKPVRPVGQAVEEKPYCKIFGYGSLMDVASARATMPTARKFRPAVLPKYTRVFTLVSLKRIMNNVADFDTMELTSAAVRPHESDWVCGVSFEIPAEEFPAYMAREARYKSMEVDIRLLGEKQKETFKAWTVIEQTEEEYAASLGDSPTAYYDTVTKFYDGKLWGRDDVYPIRHYLLDCLAAAFNFGGRKFLDNFLDSTRCGDGKTTIREYIVKHPERFPKATLAERNIRLERDSKL